MPTTLPVPSKGALKALRNLALGTSCTLALSAGILTEDRRRRIHAAREVYDNAKKLKSSSKYRSASTTAIDSFEGLLLHHQEDAFWLPSNVSKTTVPSTMMGVVGRDGSAGLDLTLPSTTPPPRPRISKYNVQNPKVPSWKIVKTEHSQHRLGSTPRPPLKVPKQRVHNRQYKLAADITKLLEQHENIDGAASRFFEAFEEGVSLHDFGILKPLMDAAVKLAHACKAQSKFASSDRVFDIVLGSDTLHEEDFYSFHPEDIIYRLLKRPSVHQQINSLDPEKLRKASSIFITKFKQEPKSMPVQMQRLGERLCAETCHFGMYDLTLQIYSRLESTRGDGPAKAIGHLITATHMKERHSEVFRYFNDYCTQTTPDQFGFFTVGSLAIESILLTGKIDQAEQALVVAAQMAEKAGIVASTTWFLKVLGCEWRSHRDLERTRTLFGRLEPLLRVTKHPAAFHGAMIQFCIEANDEPLALSYFERLRQSYPPGPGDVRIYGHFAFAKAIRNDWVGVEDDFRKMKKASVGQTYDQELSDAFAPILKLYVQSHSVSETEEFIRIFIDGLGIKLTAPLMNIMVDVYGNAKEIDSLVRWIDYAATAGRSVDSVTFNTILSTCAQKWGFAFWEVFRVYQFIRQLGPSHSNFLDEDTVPILRQIAMLGSPPQKELSRRLEVLRKINKKSADAVDSTDVLRAMTTTLAKENPSATLEIYKRAQLDQVLIESKHLTLAVKASLQLHGNNVEETSRHIWDAQRMGIDVGSAIAQIIVHQMSTMYQEGNAGARLLTDLVQRTISALEKCGMSVPARIVTHVASILERQGHYRLCIDVWDSMSSHLNLQPSSFDLVSLTVLLKAYIGLRDHVGIRWVIKILSANNLIPDGRFRLLLKNARRNTSSLLKSRHYCDNLQQFLNTLEEAIETTRLLRGKATSDKQDTKFKMMKIIKQAIADAEERRSFNQPKSLKITETREERGAEMPSKTLSLELGEPWAVEKLEEDNACGGIGIPSRKLAGVAVG